MLRVMVALSVSLLILQMPLADGVGGVATALAASERAADVCHDATPLATLPANDGVAQTALDPALVASIAQAKGAAFDPERGARDLATGVPAALAARKAVKDAAFKAGLKGASASLFSDRGALERACARGGTPLSTLLDGLGDAVTSRAAASVGPGYGWVDWLNQQGQVTWYYCGPATVSEIAHSMANNGRLVGPVGQWTAGSYMGTSSAYGTSVSAMVSGLNQYVGRPVAGWNYYAFVWLSYAPTTTERNTFVSYLEYDIQRGWPVAGDAWEEAYGPHLAGHPYNQQIFHWFELGGYGSYGGSVYYADSATTVWASVPPFSWFDMQTMITILGGRGYAW